MPPTAALTSDKPLRLWPGVTAAVLLVFFRSILPAVAERAQILVGDVAMIAMFGGLLFTLLILIWWFFLSRAPWAERLISLGVIVVAILVTRPLTHISIQNGLMDKMFYVSAPVTVSLALVLWAVASRGLSKGSRRAAMVAAIFAGCGVWTLARTDGLFNGASVLHWRWTPTAEDRLLAQDEDAPKPLPPDPAPVAAPVNPAMTPVATAAVPDAKPDTRVGPAMSEPVMRRVEWPGFRGSRRDGAVHGVSINTDWSAAPPVQLWRRPVGPGWSSFAVSGDLIYTQEQRGDDEVVACYRLSTGEPVWRHRDPVRFYESNGGAGPRGTPAIDRGRVYALGATGILNALDARSGNVAWSRNVAAETGRALPGWGFTSSPLVINDVVIVAASGTLAAYDGATGAPRWTGPKLLGSYSSPHRVTIDGVTQILFLSGSGATSVAVENGAVLWQSEWPEGGTTIVQPAAMPGGDILVNTATAMGGVGTRRLHVSKAPGAGPGEKGSWIVEERWTSNGLKPYFNDFIVHKGHAFGFDGNILASINLEDGKRNWKGGRYGNGQLVLLADQDLLLVISEDGELALVSATTEKFTEVSRFRVLDGKTWNHPVVIGDTLLVRNGEEMAAFRLALSGR